MKNLNDTSESLNENWGEQKEKLLEKYSILSEADLLFIDGKKEEMLEKVRKILRITEEEFALMLSRF
ncbi:general stress protein CsbD [Flavobacterium sp. SM15]|uniref:general stress protein CsbD n=1 Tax=Flavobacterium sp. SM15 TaxID=2908005 RepID=UPI001EDA4164|nr:general stress protein CsbD [Flavobacterium sp. SM15]MCG2610656.1 general stress protein CsbD [Flavobacterium sp. SM15]